MSHFDVRRSESTGTVLAPEQSVPIDHPSFNSENPVHMTVSDVTTDNDRQSIDHINVYQHNPEKFMNRQCFHVNPIHKTHCPNAASELLVDAANKIYKQAMDQADQIFLGFQQSVLTGDNLEIHVSNPKGTYASTSIVWTDPSGVKYDVSLRRDNEIRNEFKIVEVYLTEVGGEENTYTFREGQRVEYEDRESLQPLFAQIQDQLQELDRRLRKVRQHIIDSKTPQ